MTHNSEDDEKLDNRGPTVSRLGALSSKLENVDRKLALLSHVPQQLGTILESVMHIQSYLTSSEAQDTCLQAPTDAVSLAGVSVAGTSVVNAPGSGRPIIGSPCIERLRSKTRSRTMAEPAATGVQPLIGGRPRANSDRHSPSKPHAEGPAFPRTVASGSSKEGDLSDAASARDGSRTHTCSSIGPADMGLEAVASPHRGPSGLPPLVQRKPSIGSDLGISAAMLASLGKRRPSNASLSGTPNNNGSYAFTPDGHAAAAVAAATAAAQVRTSNNSTGERIAPQQDERSHLAWTGPNEPIEEVELAETCSQASPKGIRNEYCDIIPSTAPLPPPSYLQARRPSVHSVQSKVSMASKASKVSKASREEFLAARDSNTSEFSSSSTGWALRKKRDSYTSSIIQSVDSSNNWKGGFLLEDEPMPRCLMMPNGAKRLAWDAFIVIITGVIIGIVIPFRLAYFDVMSLREGALGILLCVSDVIWVIDILIHFRTAFLRQGLLVVSSKRIALVYLQSWFAFDILAAYPFILVPNIDAVMVTVGCLKLLRILRLGPLMAHIEKELQWFKFTSARVGILTMIFCHIMSCMWRTARRLDEPLKELPETDNLVRKYVEDTYWVQMTLTTVGYGDIAPCGDSSRLFAVIAMFIAPLFFGTIVSLITHATQGLVNDNASRQAAEAVRFMRKRRIPKELQQKVVRNLKVRLKQEENIATVGKLLAKLSPMVQRELSLELLRTTILRFPLFRNAPRAFIAELAQAHTWIQCWPGDLVVEEGQVVEEVVFLLHGRLILQQVLDRSGAWGPGAASPAAHEEVDIGSGAWFGESCLFKEGEVRTFTAFAAAESELAVLAASEYHRACASNPEMMVHHRQLQHALDTGKIDLSGLAWKGANLGQGSPWSANEALRAGS